MAQQMVRVSDVTRQIVTEGDQVEIIITQFPNLTDGPVALDASEKEVKAIGDGDDTYVAFDLVRADGTSESRIVPFQQFAAIFPSGVDVAAVIASATRLKAPKASSTAAPKKGNAEELQKIREWATANGHTVNGKGRIAASVVEAYEKAQAANPAES